MWFTQPGQNAIGEITAAGVVTEHALPSRGYPWRLVGGPDGAVWFTYRNIGKVGRITTSGVVTEYPTSGMPYAIAVGPDGAVVHRGERRAGAHHDRRHTHGIRDPVEAERSGRHSGRTRRQPLVHRVLRQQDRPLRSVIAPSARERRTIVDGSVGARA